MCPSSSRHNNITCTSTSSWAHCIPETVCLYQRSLIILDIFFRHQVTLWWYWHILLPILLKHKLIAQEKAATNWACCKLPWRELSLHPLVQASLAKGMLAIRCLCRIRHLADANRANVIYLFLSTSRVAAALVHGSVDQGVFKLSKQMYPKEFLLTRVAQTTLIVQ